MVRPLGRIRIAADHEDFLGVGLRDRFEGLHELLPALERARGDRAEIMGDGLESSFD